MKLAIHRASSWSNNWIKYCINNNIEHVVVNCYDNDIIRKLKDYGVTHLMWHFSHNISKDILMARNVLYSASEMGIKTFPNFETSWHFDDKVSQKYLLEAVDAPLVPSHAFYDKKSADNWLKSKASFPLVAKLRRGAGSYNVILLKNLREAKQYTSKMFGKGIKPTPGFLADVKNKLTVAGDIKGIRKRLKKVPGFFKMVYHGKKEFPRENGYVYFQDFIPGNKEDLRIAIVDNYIWGFKRKVRKNDFRASGSGMIHYDLSDVPLDVIKLLYTLSKKIAAQSIAFDLVKKNNDYLIVEISYGYDSLAIYNAPGYWNDKFEFINKKVNPEVIIIEKFLYEK